MSKNLLFFADFAKKCQQLPKKNKLNVRAFIRRGNLKKMRVFFSREKFQKSEYYCEHFKFGEDFGCEHFKILVIKKQVRRSFSRLQKARKKNLWVTLYEITCYLLSPKVTCCKTSISLVLLKGNAFFVQNSNKNLLDVPFCTQ